MKHLKTLIATLLLATCTFTSMSFVKAEVTAKNPETSKEACSGWDGPMREDDVPLPYVNRTNNNI